MSKATVTIVEDEAIIARELATRLTGMGYEVADIAGSKQEAVRRVEAHRPDLVFMDIVLRGEGDGIEAAEEIRKRFDVPVVYVTAYADNGTLERAKLTEPFGYILKPFSESLLRATVEMALFKHQMESRLKVANERLEFRVRERTLELEAKNRAMQEELQIAQELQLAMLPHHFPSIPRGASPDNSAVRFSSFYRAAGPVGGDFFDVIPLSDTSVAVFICDVMGHDVSAALVTAMLRALVQDIVPPTPDPGKLMSALNQTLVRFFHQLGRPMFATAFHMVADLATGSLAYSSAGHPSPMRLRRETGSAKPLLERTGPALGLLENTEYRTIQDRLASGDVYLLLTDGLIEAENQRNESYGTDRIAAAMSRNAGLDGSKLLDGILGDFRRFTKNAFLTDDICLVEMEVKRLAKPGTNGGTVFDPVI